MTIGFAATYTLENQAGFLIAADSRYSVGGSSADMAIKTYSLGAQVGAVAAGSALSVSVAAEHTRGIADDHDRLSPNARINFYSTVRLFSFVLDRIEAKNPRTYGTEVLLAGFLSNGSPALAKVVTRPFQRTEIHCYAPRQRGSLVAMVGQPDAKEQIASAAARAFVEPGQHWAERAAATIWYLSQHEGTPAIGGAPSVAICSRDEAMFWPFVVVGERTYLRGLEVTESILSPIGNTVLRLDYDENWHSSNDQERIEPVLHRDEGFFSISRHLEDWVKPSELFDWKVDPEALMPKPDLHQPPSVVLILRPGELSWLPSEESSHG